MPDLLGGLAYTWPFYAAIPIAYLVGSIPFGFVLTRLAGLGDIRTIGSANLGATNVLRTGRKGLAALTLLLDAGKGTFAVSVAGYYGPDFEVIAGLSVVVGHMFPVWLRFRGGKGVATGLGVVIAVSWPVAIAACAMWLVVAALFRYASLASMVSMTAVPALLWLMLEAQRSQALPYWLPGLPQHVEMLVALAVLVVLRHHANVGRLLKGTESRIDQMGR
jgi:glycerol-3-phosphate acyltransferase PlsY